MSPYAGILKPVGVQLGTPEIGYAVQKGAVWGPSKCLLFAIESWNSRTGRVMDIM